MSEGDKNTAGKGQREAQRRGEEDSRNPSCQGRHGRADDISMGTWEGVNPANTRGKSSSGKRKNNCRDPGVGAGQAAEGCRVCQSGAPKERVTRNAAEMVHAKSPGHVGRYTERGLYKVLRGWMVSEQRRNTTD